MKRLQNAKQVPLPLAVWLARDTYDYADDRSNYISATELLAPMKSIVLSRKIPQESLVTDIHDLVPSRIGTAIHDSVEQAWIFKYEHALKSLGYKDDFISRIRVNPELGEEMEDIIPVYLEQRSTKVVDGVTVSGKFDMIFNGRIIDTKSTSTFTYINKTNDKNYKLQGSIYRWLNPDIVFDDVMDINYVFTDWKPTLAETQKDYPQARAMAYSIDLMSYEETEAWIKQRVALYHKSRNLSEEQLPRCTNEELWRKESVWKYYRDLNKTARSTKNFNNPAEANAHALTLAQKNPNGGVLEVKGQVVKCKYCDAFAICKQKDEYIATGQLTGF